MNPARQPVYFLLLLISLQFNYILLSAQQFPKVPADMILIQKERNTIANADVYRKIEWKYLINQGKVTTDKYKARIIKYDKIGRIMEIMNLNPNGENLSIVVFKYDNNNLPIQETEFMPTGEMIGRTKYTYNHKGQLKDITWLNGFEFIINRQTFDISESNGVVTEWQYYSPDSVTGKTDYYYTNLLNGIISKESNFNGEQLLINTVIYERDSNQIILKTNYLDAAGKLSYYYDYQYDTKNNLKQILIVYPNKTTFPKFMYEYDMDGLTTGVIEYDNKGNITDYKKYSYE